MSQGSVKIQKGKQKNTHTGFVVFPEFFPSTGRPWRALPKLSRPDRFPLHHFSLLDSAVSQHRTSSSCFLQIFCWWWWGNIALRVTVNIFQKTAFRLFLSRFGQKCSTSSDTFFSFNSAPRPPPTSGLFGQTITAQPPFYTHVFFQNFKRRVNGARNMNFSTFKRCRRNRQERKKRQLKKRLGGTPVESFLGEIIYERHPMRWMENKETQRARERKRGRMKEMNRFLGLEPLLGSFTDKYYDVLPAATLGAFPPPRPPPPPPPSTHSPLEKEGKEEEEETIFW